MAGTVTQFAHQVCNDHCPHIGQAGTPANAGQCCICDAWVGDVTTAATNRGANGGAFNIESTKHSTVQANLLSTDQHPFFATIKTNGGHQ